MNVNAVIEVACDQLIDQVEVEVIPTSHNTQSHILTSPTSSQRLHIQLSISSHEACLATRFRMNAHASNTARLSIREIAS